MASDCECSRLEEKQVRRAGVKEGVTRQAERGGYPRAPLLYRYQNERLANCTKNSGLHTSRSEMNVVPAWYSKTFSGSKPPLLSFLLAGAASERRTCSGRVRNETPAIREAAQWRMPAPGHAPPRCAAIPSCRRFRSGHTACPEKVCGVREILPHKTRNATAERHRCLEDSQRLIGGASAEISSCGMLDKRVPSPGFSISLECLDPETRKEADSISGKIQ
jgi:hypothetical protein